MKNIIQDAHDKKVYDLEKRTEQFALHVRIFLKKIPKNLISIDDIKQLIRSSGSVGANYIEANGSLGKKDFLMRIKICRKEARESSYWLRLLHTCTMENISLEEERTGLHDEVKQLEFIFGAIIKKSSL